MGTHIGESFGVEEEYHLLDASTLELVDRPEILLAASTLLGELAQSEIVTSQLEVATSVCTSLAQLRSELTRLRRAAASAAADHDAVILAASVHPTASWTSQRLTPKRRYEEIEERWGLLARQQAITGCHVHVSIGEDPEVAIAVMDRLRLDLPLLLALSGSSPIWEGLDTSWQSFRTVWFAHFALTGPPPLLGSRAAFDELVADAVASGLASDASHLYWDARPSLRYPTLEVRIADVMPLLDDVVCYAEIVRALVTTCASEAAAGRPLPPIPDHTLRLARARAGRFGLTGELLDLRTRTLRPAAELAAELLLRLRPALEEAGSFEEVNALLEALLARGTASQRSRALLERTGSPHASLQALLAESICLPAP